MIETILFFAVIICFALGLIAWSVAELLNKPGVGLLMPLFMVLGLLVMIARLVLYAVNDAVLLENNFWMLFTFAVALSALYLNFRLMGTMLSPVAILVILVVEMLRGFGYMPVADFWLPLEFVLGQPWIAPALALTMLGLGLSCTTAILAAIYGVRPKTPPTEEFGPKVVMYNVTLKMPKVLSHLTWWCVGILSLGIGAYGLWCHTLYGAYWFWQPLFMIAILCWLVAFMSKCRQFN
ncbi:MAG: hypothetical protein Q4C56_09090, partial [Peptococcaceae bacterium]|nr:hypothetical protein [Peptococcaceae bacterium]